MRGRLRIELLSCWSKEVLLYHWRLLLCSVSRDLWPCHTLLQSPLRWMNTSQRASRTLLMAIIRRQRLWWRLHFPRCISPVDGKTLTWGVLVSNRRTDGQMAKPEKTEAHLASQFREHFANQQQPKEKRRRECLLHNTIHKISNNRNNDYIQESTTSADTVLFSVCVDVDNRRKISCSFLRTRRYSTVRCWIESQNDYTI